VKVIPELHVMRAKLYFSHYYDVLTPMNQWWKNMQSSRGLKCLVPFTASELCRGPPKDFEIKFMLNNGRNKFSFSCPWVTIFLHSRELKLKF
jgi:hypothetical protein